ncbi:MAG: geranylgeranylglyceryl/heptaprenylglyceryl phosphate synthase [Bacteroidales bacterium]|jgi:putative glycerol-1-phosphate prenyltransferase|nr:geranylgeranylglyceryl/heptaprenylglyceryl phosphate synthase [Bacteroidales bacterium]
MLYDILLSNLNRRKLIALLIDPDKHSMDSLAKTIDIAHDAGIAFFLFGGSIISNHLPGAIDTIKQHTDKPVFLFPGSLLQLSCQADGIFFLSLISGRNPELLIGNHVQAAPFLKKSNLEIIPVGYILMGASGHTSVEYMSQTMPIPFGKADIAVATAIAGEMLGLKAIYMEAGSGAEQHIPGYVVENVKNNLSVPLILGGGIRTPQQVEFLFNSGADVLVIGSAAEQDPHILTEMAKSIR